MAQRTLNGQLIVESKRKGEKIYVKLRSPVKGIKPGWIEMDFTDYLKKVRYGNPTGITPL